MPLSLSFHFLDVIWGYTESPYCTACLTLRALDNAKEYIFNFLIYLVMNLEKIHEVYHLHVAKFGFISSLRQ